MTDYQLTLVLIETIVGWGIGTAIGQLAVLLFWRD